MSEPTFGVPLLGLLGLALLAATRLAATTPCLRVRRCGSAESESASGPRRRRATVFTGCVPLGVGLDRVVHLHRAENTELAVD